MGAVGAAVGGVGIDLERGVGTDQIADGGDLLDVVARLDLQLDADVAVVDVALHRGEQFVDRVVDADADAARDAGGGGAEEVGERAALRPELGVEHGHLERALGHRMTVQFGEAGSHVGRFERAAGHQPGEQVVDHHVLGAVDVLGGVARLAQCHAFTPALGAPAVGGRQFATARAGCRARSGSRSSCGTARRAASRSGAARLVPASRSRAGSDHGRDPITYSPARVNPTIGRPAANAPCSASATSLRQRATAAGSVRRSSTTSAGVGTRLAPARRRRADVAGIVRSGRWTSQTTSSRSERRRR